ncbi:ral guanine nucleotide dissociation stimulator-like isoform X2 [Panthera tigris]|uniref:ral guanine nucleotide dissociation stimulator-like isoform X2 n=1 Tax=Panthera tigris TaxID=9694 RepID=UPI001C6F934C|nr:ral guanine nucleotide dissociation stimulator-like isoform X2 [Panthera tigris]
MGQELNDESPCSTSLKDRRKPCAANRMKFWLRGKKAAPVNENENCVEETIEGGWMLLEQRVEHLVPAFLWRDPTCFFTFLGTYRAFATTQQVLELLFMRYGCFLPDTEEDGGPWKQEKMAISSILGTWMDYYPEEFFQPQNSSA